MAAPLSSDLRGRVVRSASEGALRRQAAERFGISSDWIHGAPMDAA